MLLRQSWLIDCRYDFNQFFDARYVKNRCHTWHRVILALIIRCHVCNRFLTPCLASKRRHVPHYFCRKLVFEIYRVISIPFEYELKSLNIEKQLNILIATADNVFYSVCIEWKLETFFYNIQRVETCMVIMITFLCSRTFKLTFSWSWVKFIWKCGFLNPCPHGPASALVWDAECSFRAEWRRMNFQRADVGPCEHSLRQRNWNLERLRSKFLSKNGNWNLERNSFSTHGIGIWNEFLFKRNLSSPVG